MRVVRKRTLLEHLQYVNLGMAGTIRFAKKREGFGVLNQSVSEHLVGMSNIIDIAKRQLSGRYPFADWDKVDKMLRYHDVGEIETGDVVKIIKNGEHTEKENKAIDRILEQFPEELGGEISELLREKEELETIEARIVHLIDKIEPQIIIATEKGIQEIRDLYQSTGINIVQYAIQKNNYLRSLLVEWELDVDILVELVEEIWERQKELGILEEDPQLRLELELDKEEK